MTAVESSLWKPLKLGHITLDHRLVMAPMTRFRNDDNHVPLDMMTQYYADRASTPGTLIISEATGVSPAAEAEPNSPGISTDDQIQGWGRIYRAVHSKGCFMFQQLWDLGRSADPEYLNSRGFKYVSSSNTRLDGRDVTPAAMTEDEIWQKIAEFRNAARNVIAAGGDGVEIHGAHGFLVDQFTRDSVNKRTDKWGGSVENRARFLLEIIKAVVEEIGAERTAFRMSPFSTFQDCYSSDTWVQTRYIIRELKTAGYKLAYISIVEPRSHRAALETSSPQLSHDHSPFGDKETDIDFVLKEWSNQSPVIIAGSYTRETSLAVVDGKYKQWNVAVAFGRDFISNPDLIFRIKMGIPLNPYNRDTFYTKKNSAGYNDYAFSDEFAGLAASEPVAAG